MTGKEKLYFLLNRIEDVREITPKGQFLKIHATHNLNKKYRGDELDMLLTKLEKDEKVLKVIKPGNRIKEIGHRYGLNEYDDGHYHIKLLPSFNEYFLKIQHELEYQNFTGKTPLKVEAPTTESATIIEAATVNIPTNIVLADLESLYGEIAEEKNRVQFFIKVAQYGKYIQDNKASSLILSDLYKDAKEDADLYLKAWKKFVNVWKEYAKDLLKKAEEAEIKDDPNNPLSNEVSVITAKLQETETSIWETDLSYFYNPYQTLIWKFKNVGKAKLLVPKHVEATEDGMITIYPYYVEACSEWDKFKYLREAKPWWAHYQICRLAVGVLGTKEKRQYFKRDSIIDAFYKFEFDEVAKGNINRSPIVLHQDKYEVWIKRLHKYLIPRLQNAATTQKQNEELDYSDTATRRALEKKWNVIQAIWTSYESSNRGGAVMLSMQRLPGNLTLADVDGILEGFKKEKLFRSWDRKDRYYFVEYIDHDLFPEYYLNLKDLYRKFATAYQINVEQPNFITRNESNKEPTKKQLQGELSNIIKTGKFGKKEKLFLKFLAKDFGPKTIVQIGEEVGSKACKQLKARINTRIKNTGFYIETIRAEKWGGQAHYQLRYGTQSVKSRQKLAS